MRNLAFFDAIEDALAQAMAADPRILLFGEDVRMIHRTLFVRFGPDRVRDAPISESAFLGAAVTAAMGGLRPVVELMMVDFAGVAMDALLNHAAKVAAFSGGSWTAPLVIRAPCGAGYGDAGQHGQSLWGWLAHIPGLPVLVPADPADAGALMTAALAHDGPVVFLEHKLLSAPWLDFLGRGGRKSLRFDVPGAGARGPVPNAWTPLPLGRAILRHRGSDLVIATVGVAVHRALEAAIHLRSMDIDAAVLDLRCVSPLDTQSLCEAVSTTGRLLVVDEDYQGFGMSGELAAAGLEAGLRFRYARVCTRETIPYGRAAEQQVLPNRDRIVEAAVRLMLE